jgi:hypothetical protein
MESGHAILAPYHVGWRVVQAPSLQAAATVCATLRQGVEGGLNGLTAYCTDKLGGASRMATSKQEIGGDP